MISNLELRHLIESSFLPLKCVCRIDDAGVLSIQLVIPQTRSAILTAPRIPTSKLISGRAIANLITQVKEEYRLMICARLSRHLRCQSYPQRAWVYLWIMTQALRNTGLAMYWSLIEQVLCAADVGEQA